MRESLSEGVKEGGRKLIVYNSAKSHVLKANGEMAHSKESRSHVGLHVLVVETHDLDQVLQRCNLH